MLMCPFCRAQVPDDSCFCDQCGKEFKFCPECGKPKTGTICAACGVPLVKSLDAAAPEGTGPSATAGLSLCGEGLSLTLVEGDFGRRGGIWPDLSAFQYISGIHGRIGRQGPLWTITDLGSTNGTKVNGKTLCKDIPETLKSGDTVMIATSVFVVK